mmetsp:Transcript_69563/g.123976  ORF Transcript_69563/g.123976 Transcript_69563/m.123976 type:complete len:110 (+) Transcript_69563:67-396(+)
MPLLSPNTNCGLCKRPKPTEDNPHWSGRSTREGWKPLNGTCNACRNVMYNVLKIGLKELNKPTNNSKRLWAIRESKKIQWEKELEILGTRAVATAAPKRGLKRLASAPW